MYQREYNVYNFLCKNDILTFENLINIFMETSNKESDSNSTGFKELYEMGYLWMIYRWIAKINRPIKAGETIKINTWASGFNKLFAYREFNVEDSNGNIISKASCIFLIIDKDSLKATRIPSDISSKYDILEKINFKDVPKYINKDELNLCSEFKILNKNVDKNGHVNNSVYINWVEECLDNKYYISEIDIIYTNEIRNKTNIKLYCNNSKGYFQIQDEKVNAKIKINYKTLANF